MIGSKSVSLVCSRVSPPSAFECYATPRPVDRQIGDTSFWSRTLQQPRPRNMWSLSVMVDNIIIAEARKRVNFSAGTVRNLGQGSELGREARQNSIRPREKP